MPTSLVSSKSMTSSPSTTARSIPMLSPERERRNLSSGMSVICALKIPATINKQEGKKSIDLKYHLYLSESFWIPLILRKRKMARFAPIHFFKEHIFFSIGLY